MRLTSKYLYDFVKLFSFAIIWRFRIGATLLYLFWRQQHSYSGVILHLSDRLHDTQRYKRSHPLLHSASVVCRPVEGCRTGPLHRDKTTPPLRMDWSNDRGSKRSVGRMREHFKTVNYRCSLSIAVVWKSVPQNLDSAPVLIILTQFNVNFKFAVFMEHTVQLLFMSNNEKTARNCH